MSQTDTVEFWREAVETALLTMREPMTLADAQEARHGLTARVVEWKKAQARAKARSFFSRFTPDSDESRAREDSKGEAFEGTHELQPLEAQRESAGLSFDEGEE